MEDYPLEYAFTYYTLSESRQYPLKASNEISFVSAFMAAGLKSMDNYVTVVARVSDSYGSSSIATKAVKVLSVSAAELSNKVNSAFTSSFERKDPVMVTTVVAATSSAINAADCGNMGDFNCTYLNREPCSTTAGTCGECKIGYIGLQGHSNTRCASALSLLPAGAECDPKLPSNVTLCEGFVIALARCTIPEKEMQNNCTLLNFWYFLGRLL